jgi:hypothetical protein
MTLVTKLVPLTSAWSMIESPLLCSSLLPNTRRAIETNSSRRLGTGAA